MRTFKQNNIINLSSKYIQVSRWYFGILNVLRVISILKYKIIQNDMFYVKFHLFFFL